MAEATRKWAHGDYTIGWICALPKTELKAALAMLDERHPYLPAADARDTNAYVLGRIGDHNVVVACLPAETTGKVSATAVAKDMVRSFSGVRLGVMVGVGGGAPYYPVKESSGGEDDDSESEGFEDDAEETRDIRLGDVVIGVHSKDSEAVLQYDFGRSVQERGFIRAGGKLNKPPSIVLAAVSILQAELGFEGHKITEQLSNTVSQNLPKFAEFQFPVLAKDRLFKSEVVHVDEKRSCKACCGLGNVNLVKRKARTDTSPRLHYGTIGSADQVVKDALLRDKWAQNENVKCFEMEAAGLMDYFPCLVIRGICDYADSHKNTIWQPYAAATAAAYAKELLLTIPGQGVKALSPIEQSLHDQTTFIRRIDRKIDLAKLPSVEGAAFNSHFDEHKAQCLPGTRIALLREIAEWAESAHGKSIFWLNGMAGTGKSTISRTVAQSFANAGLLGASFFFKKGEGDRGNASKFFTTIAAQLTAKIPDIRPLIGEAIDADPLISEKALKEQFERLILEPLSRIPRVSRQASKVILVVDALDECEREDDIRVILVLLSLFRNKTSIFLRVFLTSRPDLPIRSGFKKMSGGTYENMVLHDIPPATIKHDISIFLQHELAEIRIKRSLNTDWPSQKDVQALVEMAVPLFIFAATVCRFVAENVGNPKRRLATIISYQSENKNKLPKLDTQPGNQNRISKLEKIYLPILEQLFVMQDKAETQKLAEEFREVVGTIVILADPLSTISLANLLGVEKYDVSCKLDLLHSVLNVPTNECQPIKLLHLSFRDFLLDPERSRNSPFWVDEKMEHERIARIPGITRDEIDSHIVNTFLPAEVQYACRYWFYHVKRAHSSLKDNGQVHIFLQEYLLPWLEAMSLLRGTSESIMMIRDLLSICEADKCPNLYSFIYDAQRFTLYNQLIIEQMPLQLYCSALVFAPENCTVRKLFKRYIPPWIHRKSKVMGDWNLTLQVLEGHSHELTSVAFSPDGKVIASASQDKTVRLWNAATGATLQTLKGHLGGVSSVAFSPDGKVVVSASLDKTIKLWNAETGVVLRTLEGHSSDINSVAFSPDGKVVASASDDETVRLWDVVTNSTLRTLEGHSSVITSVAFSPDSRVVASASGDGIVRLWDAMTGAVLHTLLHGHSSEMVNSVAFSPDGEVIASASDDDTVKLWDAVTGEALRTLEGHSGMANSVAFSLDGMVVASASHDKTVRLWDAATGAKLQTLKGHLAWAKSVVFSPDGEVVASASGDGTVRLWDATPKSTLQTLGGHSCEITSVTFSPDGEMVASASNDGTARLWDAVTGAPLHTLDGHYSEMANPVAFSPGSRMAASTSRDKTDKLLDAMTGATMQRFKGHSEQVNSVALPRNSKIVASASNNYTIRLCDAATGATLQTLVGNWVPVTSVALSLNHNVVASASGDDTPRILDSVPTPTSQASEDRWGMATSATFSPNGEVVLSASYNGIIRVWDAVTGTVLQTLEGHFDEISSVVFSPDGKVVASASHDKTVRLWDTVTNTALQTLEGHSSWVSSVAFSPDGKVVASASCDKTARLWDVVTGALLLTLKGHSSAVNSVAFSPDGKVVASASCDDTARLWDAVTGALLLTLKGHSSAVNSVAFSPDSKVVASASQDKTARLWDAVTGTALQNLELSIGIIMALSFSSSGQYLETDWGLFRLEPYRTFADFEERSRALSASEEWVKEDGQNIVWLPPDYRASCVAVSKELVVLGHSSGEISFLEVRESSRVF